MLDNAIRRAIEDVSKSEYISKDELVAILKSVLTSSEFVDSISKQVDAKQKRELRKRGIV